MQVEIYHASKDSNISLEKLSLNRCGTAKNGDNQAAGIHFSTSRNISESYLNNSGSLLITNISERTIESLEDFYNDSNYFPYLNILVDIIGEDFIDDVVDKIEEEPTTYTQFNTKEEILNSLIFSNPDLMENIKENFDINSDLEDKIEQILSYSFELDEHNCNHQTCYMMLSATLESRTKASELLIKEGVLGFKYRQGDIENLDNEYNLCIFDKNILKQKQVISKNNTPKSKKISF